MRASQTARCPAIFAFARCCDGSCRTSTCFSRRATKTRADWSRLARSPSESTSAATLKFEVKPPRQARNRRTFAQQSIAKRLGRLIVAGSTLEGEEAMLLEMFRQVARAIPERCWCWLRGIPSASSPWRLSAGVLWPAVAATLASGTAARAIAGGIFLLDTIGELASLYEFADIAFVGGSLVPRGGHNVLEAAQFGTAILVGPHTENFRDIVDVFRKPDALRVVTPAIAYTHRPAALLENHDERTALASERPGTALAAGRHASTVTRCSVCCRSRAPEVLSEKPA